MADSVALKWLVSKTWRYLCCVHISYLETLSVFGIKQLSLHSFISACGSSSSNRIDLGIGKSEMALKVVAILFLVSRTKWNS